LSSYLSNEEEAEARRLQIADALSLLMPSIRVRNYLTRWDLVDASKELKIKNEKTAKKYVISNCDDRVMHSINPNETFDQIIAKLYGTYGFGILDPAVILNELHEIKFHPSKDPSIVLN
jgi:hypothetical protein